METTQNTNGKTFKGTESIKFTGNWASQSKALKTQFAQLTDTDVKLEAGKEEELLARLQAKLGKNREEVIAIIKKGQLEKA